jgi:1-phosphofructokinase
MLLENVRRFPDGRASMGTALAFVLTVTLNPAIDKTLEAPGFHVGGHLRAQVRAVVPAGKGVNVARGLARLGGRAVAAGFIGRDEEGMFAESLGAEGVQTVFVEVAGRTRTNTTVLDPVAHTTTHLREPGFEVGRAEIERLRAVLPDWVAARADAAVVFSGSLPTGIEPQDFASLIALCSERGAEVIVDANGSALQAAVESGAVDTLKPNLEELGECLGRSVEVGEAAVAARRLLDRVGAVLLTLGAEGAFLVRPDLALGRRCRVPDAGVRNTVGCGDAFLAGWLRGRQVCADPAGALSWAVAAGAASAMAETTVGYTLADVQALLPRCEPIT